jgi:hypothetical protein
MMAMLMKIAKLIDSALCRAMGLPFKLLQNSLSSDPQSFGTIVDELMCGKRETSKKEKDQNLAHTIKHAAGKPKAPPTKAEEEGKQSETIQQAPLSNTNPQSTGVAPNEPTRNEVGKYKELATLISTIATKDELITAMTSDRDEQNILLMKNISNVIKLKLPEYAEAFEDEEATIDFFVACGNLVDSDQRALLRQERNTPDGNFPINKTSCLTSDQKAEWDQNRTEAFINAGFDPSLAREHVDKLNRRRDQDFADALDALIQAPEEQFRDALNSLLRPPSKDPDCSLPSLLDPEPEAAKEEMRPLMEGLFAGLQKAYVDDLIHANYFSTFFGLNSPGILSQILANKNGFTLNFHNFLSDNKFFRFLYTGEWGGDLPAVPETVGILMRDKLLNQTQGNEALYNYPFDSSPNLLTKEKESIKLTFNNDVEKGAYKSRIFMYEALKDKESRVKQSFDYKLKIRSKLLNKTFQVQKMPASGDEAALLDTLLPEDYVSDKYKSVVFKNLILRQYGKNTRSDLTISNSSAHNAVKAMNELIYGRFIGKLISGEGGSIPQGHIYGDEDVQLTSEDVEYVGPNGEEYDYDEEEMILGRSKTNNPRVKFLDPAMHGGSYSDPFMHIESTGDCGGQRGWMKLGRVFMPELMCGEMETNFLYIKNIVDRIDEVSGKIERHDQLDFAPECVVERLWQPWRVLCWPR